MAGSILQQRALVSNTGSTTISDTITGVTLGSIIVAFVGCDNTGGITISGVSDGTSYTVGDGPRADVTNNQSGKVFYLENAGAGSHTVTATATGGTPTNMQLRLIEVGGCLTSGSLDQHTGQVQASPGTGTDGVSSGATAATTNANDFVLGFTQNTGEGLPGTSVITAGTGFVKSGTGDYLAIESKNVSATGAQTATFTQSVNVARVSHVLAFKTLNTSATPIKLAQIYPISAKQPKFGPYYAPFVGDTGQSVTILQASGVSISTSVGSGELDGSGILGGVSIGNSVATGNLSGTGALGGTSIATSVATGNLSGNGILGGVSIATSTAVGGLIGTGSLGGVSLTASSAVGALTGAGSLSGVSISASLGVGDLQNFTGGAISGVSISRSSGVGNLQGSATLSGVSISMSLGVGDLQNFTPGGGTVPQVINLSLSLIRLGGMRF